MKFIYLVQIGLATIVVSMAISLFLTFMVPSTSELWFRLVQVVTWTATFGILIVMLSTLIGIYFGKKHGRLSGWSTLAISLFLFIVSIFIPGMPMMFQLFGLIILFLGIFLVGRPEGILRTILLISSILISSSFILSQSNFDPEISVGDSVTSLSSTILILTAILGQVIMILKLPSMRKFASMDTELAAWPDSDL